MDSRIIQSHEEVKWQYDLYNQGAYQPIGSYMPPGYDPSVNMRTSHFGQPLIPQGTYFDQRP